MSRLIMSMIMLIILAVVVGYNASHTAPFELPWLTIEDVSVVAIGLISFVLGVLLVPALFAGAIRPSACRTVEGKAEEAFTEGR